METIISKEEKRRRDKEAKRKTRRLQGQVSRKEYLAKEKNEKQSRYQEIIKAHKENPKLSQRKLAALTGYSPAMINKALATLKE